MRADVVGHVEGVEGGIGVEEAAVVGGDVEAGVALVNGAEEALEVLPDGPRVVRIAVLEGAPEGVGGQQAVVFANGAEQDAVEELLREAKDVRRGDGGVSAAEAAEDALDLAH